MRKPSLVVSLITQDNDYQVEQAAAAEETARRIGVDVQVIIPGQLDARFFRVDQNLVHYAGRALRDSLQDAKNDFSFVMRR